MTVGIGEWFHTHFEAYSDASDLPQVERERRAAAQAAGFIADFMADRILLRVTRDGGSAGTLAVESAPPPGPEEIDYLWSGPKS